MNIREFKLAIVIAIMLSAIFFAGISPVSAQRDTAYRDIVDDNCTLEPGKENCKPSTSGNDAKLGLVIVLNSDIPRFLSPPPIVW